MSSKRDLDFATLRDANSTRCKCSYHSVVSWSLSEWACALGGETGDVLNLIKKIRLGGSDVHSRDIEDGIADVVICADLLMSQMNMSLEEAVRQRFNKTSKDVGSDVHL